MGRRKSHHTHEVGDAYAEGWAAHENWDERGPKPLNPYALVVEAANKAKQSAARRASQQREIELWDEGWNDYEEDFDRDDLEAVSDFDFRHLSKA